MAEELVRTSADYFDVIGLEIKGSPTISRFGKTGNVCHDKFDAMV